MTTSANIISNVTKSNNDRILIINAGSSSVKFAIYTTQLAQLLKGAVQHIGTDHPTLTVSGAINQHLKLASTIRTVEHAAAEFINWLKNQGVFAQICAVGHRIVHGGPKLIEPQLVTNDVLDVLRANIDFAPNHLPTEIRLIELIASHLVGIPQVVCFDTTFHKSLSRVATQLPIPKRYYEKGVRRYGFHGLSFAYLITELEQQAGQKVAHGKVILAHLGAGSSLAAVESGQCRDTSMGLSPTGGVMMATRTGDIDPGVMCHVMRTTGMTINEFDHFVNQESGILGISGTSADVRDLLSREQSDPAAAAAIESYCYSVQKGIAAMATALGGVETLVFSGGIGEHSAAIRSRIATGLKFLGVMLDPPANINHSSIISSPDSTVTVRVIATDEEVVIADTVLRFMLTWPADCTSSVQQNTISEAQIEKMDAYWRAANYLSVGQIYLMDNPLLREPLQHRHIKSRLLGHWGTTPGLNLIYVHLNRIIREHDLNILSIVGPGHGGPGIVANVYLEGTYSEVYPDIKQDADGMRKLFKQFSFPGGVGSHCTPETPGSIHEGGELGYALSHAYGAAFDNPDLLVACVVGDGEAETGPLATAWHSNKFLNPVRDGAVLPILHLNGFKIANPTVLARIPNAELRKLFEGYGYKPYFVEGDEPKLVHRILAETLEQVISDIRHIQSTARSQGFRGRPTWPMIILRTPKGWTCPKEIDGKRAEGSWRSHQVPMGNMDSDDHIRVLEAWMKSYRPEELFDERGALRQELAVLAPIGDKRMGANPHANGGVLLQDLTIPNYRDYAVNVQFPGEIDAEATRVQGKFLRDVMALNRDTKNFRLFSPDELASNRWQDVLEVTDRCFVGSIDPTDATQESPDGRAMEVLSEHQCQGWLEGYLLTGRHGFFSCYEAFVHIVDSMVNQHAKWIKVCREVAWRKPIASLNYLLSSHVWRQDHNGFSHQDPGFIDHVINKKAEVVRVYLPPDANTLLSVTDHCLRSRNYVNVVVAGKQPAPQWLTMTEAETHCAAGVSVWQWASNDAGDEPDVVLACCGDVPTLEVLAAVDLAHQYLPSLKVRVVNVVDLMKLQPASEHPHGLSDAEFDAIFTRSKPIIFAFHGYPWLIHRLTYRRMNHSNLHVRGYVEEGTTTTPFDMCVLNRIDRYHLVLDMISRVPGLASRSAEIVETLNSNLAKHKQYIRQTGTDLPEISQWRWKCAIK